MGVRRVARRGPGSPAVLGKQKMISGVDLIEHGMGVPVRRDSGVDVGMDVGMGEMEVDESGDVCMIMDEDFDYDF